MLEANKIFLENLEKTANFFCQNWPSTPLIGDIFMGVRYGCYGCYGCCGCCYFASVVIYKLSKIDEREYDCIQRIRRSIPFGLVDN